MKKFFQNYQDWVLGFFGILLFTVIILCFAWGLTALGTEIPRALQPPKESSQPLRFDFEGYKTLNLGTQ